MQISKFERFFQYKPETLETGLTTKFDIYRANQLKTHCFGTVVQASALDGGCRVPGLYVDPFLARPGTTGKFMELV